MNSSDLSCVMGVLREIAPLSRTLVHDDNERALNAISRAVDGLEIESFNSGSVAWTWRIPNNWKVLDSKISDADTGELLWDGTCHPLATVNYSLPFSGVLTPMELAPHLHSAPHRPNAIPFVFRFYNRDWGLCVPFDLRENILSRRSLNVQIDIEEKPGKLQVGVYTLPGETENEFVICTNICHPGTANDSISGAAAAIALIRHLERKVSRNYTYRFLWVPETIGTVAYLAKHQSVVDKAIGGLFIEMLGNENSMCLQHSRRHDTYWDRLAVATFQDSGLEFRSAPFIQSASNDEKVMDSPGVDIPTISITRYPYPEYHTSDDNVDLISPTRMGESIELLCSFLDRIESDYVPLYVTRGPVCLAEHGLYPDWYRNPNLKAQWDGFLKVMYALDDRRSVEALAYDLRLPIDVVRYWCDAFAEKGFVTKRRLAW